MATSYLDSNGLLYYDTKIKGVIATKANSADVTSALGGKVDKVTGMGLSHNDLTDELVQKINAAGEYATLDGTPLEGTLTKAGLDIAAKSDFDAFVTSTNTSLGNLNTSVTSLSNNKADKTEVTSAIASAISGVTQFDYEIVNNLPQEGVKGTIYLVLYSSGAQGDIYKEYIWVESGGTGSFENLGYTNEIDLSNYLTKDDVLSITNAEIDALFPSQQSNS